MNALPGLVLERCVGQEIVLLTDAGQVVIRLDRVGERRASVRVSAPRSVRVMRGELCGRQPAAGGVVACGPDPGPQPAGHPGRAINKD